VRSTHFAGIISSGTAMPISFLNFGFIDFSSVKFNFPQYRGAAAGRHFHKFDFTPFFPRFQWRIKHILKYMVFLRVCILRAQNG
jgi:hypothetical protein